MFYDGRTVQNEVYQRDTGRCFKNFPTLPVYHYELRGAARWL